MREKGTYMVIKNKSAESYLISLFRFDIIKMNYKDIDYVFMYGVLYLN